ncbi:riboflavin kinase [Candidatus Gracilibacteria bacterium]|jgi:riboflavin kinase/FMN adenylyltransferase|nr:riboflavin kinase [Candidatus Gracilibacteria bacterium]
MEIIEGQVVKGFGLGKNLGFPTVNILYDGKLSGVFAGKIFIDGKSFFAAIHVGKRPTISEEMPVLEAHVIYDFKEFDGKNLVGEKIKVEILKKIRETKKFADLNELKKQIAKDVKDVGYFVKEKH